MNTVQSSLNRRELLTATGATVAGLMFQHEGQAATPSTERVLRLAHLTDLYLLDDRNAPAGLIAALKYVHALKDRPDLIMTGGDTIMDSLAESDTSTTAQWKLYHEIMQRECSIEVKSCIGNHDIWGWDKQKSQTTGDESLWGKKRAVRLQELFKQNPQVKLCLGGHLHLVERVDYAGVTCLCHGAVCGGWWNGDHRDCDEGYGLVDLYADGSFNHQYVTYSWQVKQS